MTGDLLSLCATLVDLPSVSHNEAAIADFIDAYLSDVPHLMVTRVGNNVVATTARGHEQRLLLAGHLDTVPPNGNERSKVEGDVLWGLGAADMKGGLAVLCTLARAVDAPALDVTYVFYVCEEVEQKHNGLKQLLVERPDLLACDAAVLCEPTGGMVEAGCQGAMRIDLTLMGERAHTARPWMGENAVHRLGPLLGRLARYEGRRPVIDGCEYREALQAVRVDGFVAYNVVPDRVLLSLNHRFAPDRTAAEAESAVREVIGDVLAEADLWEMVDVSLPAPPALDHPLLRALVDRCGAARAKLGWTDVSFFAEQGTPATNLGPGDPNLAHSAGERVHRDDLDSVYGVLRSLLLGEGRS